MNTKALMGLGLASMFTVAGCGAQDTTLSYEQFKASAYQEPDTGVYILNQDEIAENEDELRAAYARYAGEEFNHANGVDSKEQGLIVNRVGSADDKWSSSAALNITYCISTSSFGTRKAAVVSAMNSATAAWEGTGARINFVYNSAQDSNCTASNTSVVFDVRQTSTTSYLARAFFPSNSRSARNVLISTSAFGSISPYTLAGILRHELGHTLGFRHEHTRPEAGGVCFEDNSWRALTSYDSRSVMHYPQCNGTNTGDLNLTSSDTSGARALYP